MQGHWLCKQPVPLICFLGRKKLSGAGKRLWTAWSIHLIRNDKQMKKILLCLFIVLGATIDAQKIMVACVGNSVTYGH